MSIVAKRWMDEDATLYRSRPRPRPHCTRWGPSSHERGTATPLFSAHVYCGHGRPSQLLLSSCKLFFKFSCSVRDSVCLSCMVWLLLARELIYFKNYCWKHKFHILPPLIASFIHKRPYCGRFFLLSWAWFLWRLFLCGIFTVNAFSCGCIYHQRIYHGRFFCGRF